MTFAPKELYGRGHAIWVLFDIQVGEAVRQLHTMRACLQGYSGVEALDAEHMVFIIQSGGARGCLRREAELSALSLVEDE